MVKLELESTGGEIVMYVESGTFFAVALTKFTSHRNTPISELVVGFIKTSMVRLSSIRGPIFSREYNNLHKNSDTHRHIQRDKYRNLHIHAPKQLLFL